MAILARLEKVRRYLAGRLAPADALPLFWHVGRPNFGDDINPSFFAKVSGRAVRLATDRIRPHLLGAGSILERASPTAIVCGSGFLCPPQGPVTATDIVAVRGTLSQAACPHQGDVLLGDPLVLIDAFAPPVEKIHRFGFVPHVTAVDRWRRLGGRGVHIIHPGWSPWRVIGEIASCEVVFSQSLHGLIVADALGVPNAWIAPSGAMAGGRFKFDDYFSTIDRPKEPVPESRDVFSAPPRQAADLGQYRFSKADYRRSIAAACARLAERLGAGPAT